MATSHRTNEWAGPIELLLELKVRGAPHDRGVDVVVEIDPGDSVSALIDAAVRFLSGSQMLPSDTESGIAFLARDTTTTRLALDDRIGDTGLVSGDTLHIAPVIAPVSAPRHTSRRKPPNGPLSAGPAAVYMSLDITSGPEAGRVVPLTPGQLSVGRHIACDVAIADRTVSREQFVADVDSAGNVVIIPNPEAKNGTVAGDELMTEPFPLSIGDSINAGITEFTLRSTAPDATRRRDGLGQVAINRVPYHRTVVRPHHFDDLKPPPEPPRSRGISLAMALSPLAMSGGMAVMTGRYYFLVFALLSPILLIYRQISSRRGNKKRYAKDKADFYARVEDRAQHVDEALEAERQTRLAASPDLAELGHQAAFHMPRLWERNRAAPDFLDLRLGIGDLRSAVTAEIARGGEEELRVEGEERLAHQGVVPQVPITVPLRTADIVGIWGDSEQAAATFRAVMSQACCVHSPEDLVVAAALGPDSIADFGWVKWLPHLRSSTSPLDGERISVGADEGRVLMANLLAVASARAERRDQTGAQLWPRLIVLLDENAELDRALLSQLLDVGPANGLHVLWLGASDLQVPRQCRAVIECRGTTNPARLSFTDPDIQDHDLDLDSCSVETALGIARSLAPLRDASTASQTTAIPKVVPLFDALGIDDPRPESITARWQAKRPYQLQFPIGMSATGPLLLDLVEHGPHTLIGGTSGAGKSELLQSMVLSLASNHSPERLNFLFVDYKGGASSASFRNLPHTVGYVTNLDDRLSMRALTSLRAELNRRMQLMEGRAKDLDEMLVVAPDEAPPSLVIVVDEFATLVREVPDFMTGIVDIAQRGRSLGIHLVLATQRPTGVVNDNILANTNLRIALRMLDPADSNNIIGSRDAADIPVPLRGRGYARTGPQTLVPFQCAWSGAPFATERQTHAASVQSFDLQRQDPIASAASAEVRTEEPRTQMEVLVDACAAAALSMQLPAVRRPWVEPLGEVVPLRVMQPQLPGEMSEDPGRVAVLGIYDDPANQAQAPALVDLEASGGLIVFGTGGSGKTTLLRTVALAMAQQGSPDEVLLYAMDFASRGLQSLEELPHCGAVIAGDDVERVTRLLTVLSQEIERRQTELGEARAESLGALRRSRGATVWPRIILLLDSYSGFHSSLENAKTHVWVRRLQQIVSSGRQVGIHCVFTTERRMGVPSALLSAISARLVLRMATPDELATLGVPSKIAKGAELGNGRGFLGGSIETQLAVVSDDHEGSAQAEALVAAGKALSASYGTAAPSVPELPNAFVIPQPANPRRLHAPLGMTDIDLSGVDISCERQNMVVAGPPLSGKSTALKTIAVGLRESTGTKLYMAALGSVASPLANLDLWDDTGFARAKHADLIGRLSELLAGDDGVDARAVLFVDAAEDLDGNDVLRPLEALAKRDALRLVVACELPTISKAFSGWMATLRRNRSALVLQPTDRTEVEAAAGVKPELRPGQDFPPGRGVLVANRRWSLIQVGQRR